MKKWIALIAAAALVVMGAAEYQSRKIAQRSSVIVIAPDALMQVRLTNRSLLRSPIERLSIPMDRTVFLLGPIGGKGTLNAAKQITILGRTKDPLYVVINSGGGSVFDGAAVIEAMDAAQGPVHTVCISFCASMGAMIFEHGDQRMVFNRSILMFHPASSGMEGELDRMISQLLAVQRFIKKMEVEVATRAGLSFDQYKALAAKELWLESDSAISQHFADKIVFIDLPDDVTQQEAGLWAQPPRGDR